MSKHAAYYAEQSDPTCNRQFSRLWSHPLADLPEPCRLDRQADVELQLGHQVRAEWLAHRAAELRLAGGDRGARRVGGA